MSGCLGNFTSLNQAVRHYIMQDSSNWTLSWCGRFLSHSGGLRLVNQSQSTRWTVCEPVGYISLSALSSYIIWFAIKFSRKPIAREPTPAANLKSEVA